MRHRYTLFFILALLLTIGIITGYAQESAVEADVEPTLLTDPFLQMPGLDSIHVVWFTEFEGSDHSVTYGADLESAATAETMKMSRTAEDASSHVGEQTENGQVYSGYTPRDIWRHEATVTGLTAGERVPYYVSSTADDGTEIVSEQFTLAPLPESGQALQILLTSDHQLKAMTPANMEMVEKTVGQVDAVFFAGDLINVPDRASEWFDDNRGWSFFPGLQGNAGYTLARSFVRDGITFNTERTYVGGELIQHAPLFPVVGNHEVMGRYNPGNAIGTQFNDPVPDWAAEARYEQLASLVNPNDDPAVREQWINDNSFNTVTYEEIFTLPDDSPGGETYYAMQFGDVYMISLYSTRIWRTPSLGDSARGKYREPLAALNTPDNWGYGDFIFEDLAVGSEQYDWLVEQLNSEALQNAPYKVVVMHQAPHGVGDNYNPVFAHPQQIIDYNEDGSMAAVRYEYPIEDDIIVRDVEPLLNEAGIQLVHSGHSHLWFRMQNEAGVNFLETSNVGNNYGCYLEGYKERGNIPNDPRFDAANYVAAGDPHGLEPIFPSEYSPQQDDEGNDLPCINSNTLTSFSILDTGTGLVNSYVFDTSDPESEVRLFDQFSLTSE